MSQYPVKVVDDKCNMYNTRHTEGSVCGRWHWIHPTNTTRGINGRGKSKIGGVFMKLREAFLSISNDDTAKG